MNKELKKLKRAEIVPYENNPRKNDEAVAAVAESIRQCGYVSPIIVDEENVILAGHTRYRAMSDRDEIEVMQVTGLTEDEKKKFRLLDNKTNEFAGWDYELLDIELEGLDFEDFDFGFFESDDGFSDNFSLKDGDREPIQNMTLTFSDDEAEAINMAIKTMKGTQKFKDYDNPINKNSNGNALFLVVDEWLQQKI